MGARAREFSDDGVSPPLSEALVLATMCIIGLPVEVHVKDGSVYSGILHTACLGKDYGIILKKARMIKKGKLEANVAHGGMVETLVILTGDLVQVVAKGVQLSDDDIVRNITGEDTEAVAGTIPSFECLGTEAKMLKPSNAAVHKKQINNTRNSVQNENEFAHGFMATPSEDNLMSKIVEHEVRRKEPSYLGSALEIENGKRDSKILAKSEEAPSFPDNGRQVGDDRIQGKQDHSKQKYEFHRKETAHEIQGSSSSLDACITHMKPVEAIDGKMASELLPNGVSHDGPAPSCVKPNKSCSERASAAVMDDISSGVSTSSNSVVGVTSVSCPTSLATPTEMVLPRSSISNKSAKESKLNPGAKVFSPSFTHPRSVTPPAVPAVASVAYVPNNSTVVPVASSQPEIGIGPFAPRSSLPVKFVPYSNLIAGNGGSGSQYSQPIIGHMASRPQPVRYAGQYQPVQAGPAYVHPNSQAVMVGRFGQLVYVHPVSYDVVPGAAAISQLSARPLLTPNQVQFPKHQGSVPSQALQLCVPPPVLANGQQPFAVPSHIPLVQPPFPANRPIPVPGSNALFNTKFP